MDFRNSYTVFLVFCLTLKCSIGFPSVSQKAYNTDLKYFASETHKEQSPVISVNSHTENFLTRTDENLFVEKNISNRNESDKLVLSLAEKQNERNINYVNKNENSRYEINENFKQNATTPFENRKTAESNNYISQMIPNHIAHKQNYDHHTGDVGVSKLGNTPENQGKVIYIPVYDSPNHNGHLSKNVQNTLIHNSQHKGNKKAVGYIGVVFVDKMKPENAIIPSITQQKGNQHNSFSHPNTHISHGMNHHKSQSGKGFKQQGKTNLDAEDYRLLLQQAVIKHPKIQWQNQEVHNSNIQWQNQEVPKSDTQWQNQEVTKSDTQWQNQEVPKSDTQWQNQEVPKSDTQWQNQEVPNSDTQWQNQEVHNPNTQWKNHNKFVPGNEQWQSPDNAEWQIPQMQNSINGQLQNNQMFKTVSQTWQNPNLSNNGNVKLNYNNLKHKNQKPITFGNSHWKNQKMSNPNNGQWKNQKVMNPNIAQWHNNNQVIGGNTWEVNPGLNIVPQGHVIQGQSISTQGNPWPNNQNIHLGQTNHKNQNPVIMFKGNSKKINQHNRPLSENPLFPTRGKPQSKSLTPSNNNGNTFHEKKIVQGNVHWIDETGQLKTNTKHGHQKNFNLNNIHSTAHALPETHNEDSVQYIPVIQHVVIEKSSVNNGNNLLNNGNHNSGAGVHQGDIHNFEQFDQLPKFLPNPVPSGYDQSNHYNGQNKNNMNYNAVYPQMWNSISENGKNEFSDLHVLQTPNNLFQPHHSKRNGRMPQYEHVSGNSKLNFRNSNHKEIPVTVDQENPSNSAVFKNLPNVISNQHISQGFSQQEKGITPDNPITQEFSSDPQIREAFRVAGIYLQNKNNLPTNHGDLKNTHNNLHTKNLNVAYNNEARNTQSPHTNNIKATTDQRYNALVHERNNNLNVIKTDDHLLQLNSPNIAQLFGQVPENVKENTNQQTYDTADGDYQNFDQPNGFSGDTTRNLNLDSFKTKSAIVYPRQQTFDNQNHADQYTYNDSPLQRNPSVENRNKNGNTYVFTGYGQKDSAKGSIEGRSNQRSYENNVNADNTDNGNSQDQTSKLWHQRYSGNYPLNSNSGKSEGENVSSLKDADGSDSNGFGGESFWK